MHALVAGIADLQPFRNLFRRPVQDQFTGHDRPQLLFDGKKAHLGSQSRLPGLTIGFTGSIEWPPNAPPPGSPSTQAVATRWLSPESTNRMQFHVRCLPARPASAFAASAGEQQELSRRAASTGTE